MNLQEVFLQILKISISASFAALIVMALHLIFRKAPRGLICALWLLVAIRLLIWQLPASKVSVVPEAVSSGSAVTRLAESIVILLPMLQFGCLSASSTVIFLSSSKLFPRNGPPEQVSRIFSGSFPFSPFRH